MLMLQHFNQLHPPPFALDAVGKLVQ